MATKDDKTRSQGSATPRRPRHTILQTPKALRTQENPTEPPGHAQQSVLSGRLELKQKWYRDNGYWDRVLTSKDHPGGIGGIVYADEIRKEARGRIFG
jgi:hypothetical protein